MIKVTKKVIKGLTRSNEFSSTTSFIVDVLQEIVKMVSLQELKMPYNKKQKHEWYLQHEEQLKVRRDKKREKKSIKDFLLVQFNRHNRSYQERHHKFFPIVRTEWVVHFEHNPEFNHVYKEWERSNFNSEKKPQIEKKGRLDKWEICNLQTVPYDQSSLNKSREVKDNHVSY